MIELLLLVALGLLVLLLWREHRIIEAEEMEKDMHDFRSPRRAYLYDWHKDGGFDDDELP